jgi:hypothetical protein
MENMKCKMMNKEDTVAFFKNAKDMSSDFDFTENDFYKKINYRNKFDICGNPLPIFIATERENYEWEVLFDSFYFADSKDN